MKRVKLTDNHYLVCKEELLHGIDPTPDWGYPLRILRAHLHNATQAYVESNPPETGIVMNKLQAQRACLLRAAIKVLEDNYTIPHDFADATIPLSLITDENSSEQQRPETD